MTEDAHLRDELSGNRDGARAEKSVMGCWHITVYSPRRKNLFPDEVGRRAAVRAIARIGGHVLLLFCVVDDHVHVVVVGSSALVTNLRRALVLSLSKLAGEALASHARSVESRAHLVRLVTYLLTQPSHHGITVPLASYSGSCFQDLIGARIVDGFSPLIARELPRLRGTSLYSAVGLPPTPLAPADLDVVRAAGAWRVTTAAFAALAAGPSLTGRSFLGTRARRAAAQLARHAGIARSDVAWALEVTRQRVGQLVAGPEVPAAVLRAARMQLSLESATAALARETAQAFRS